MSITLQMKGEKEVLEALDLDVEGQMEAALDRLLGESTEFARITTPVATGAMAGAWQWARSGLEGRVEIDPSAVNPVSGARVADYAPIVDARLGIVDAAFQRVVTTEITEAGWEE